MPALAMPPVQVQPPAYVVSAPECRLLADAEAQEAFRRLRSKLKGTNFKFARPSSICGMVQVVMGDGAIVYTDATGRYILFAYALDTHTGDPADKDRQVSAVFNKLRPEAELTELPDDTGQ